MPDKPEKKLCGAKLRKKDAYCKADSLYPNGRCYMHGGPSFGQPGGNMERAVVCKERLADKIDKLMRHGDPMDVMRPLATSAVILQEFVGRITTDPETLTAETAKELNEMAESLVRSVTRVQTVRNQTALTAAEISLIQNRMADAAIGFVEKEKLSGFFAAIQGIAPVSNDGTPRLQLNIPVHPAFLEYVINQCRHNGKCSN
jgi:hypothetical protein